LKFQAFLVFVGTVFAVKAAVVEYPKEEVQIPALTVNHKAEAGSLLTEYYR